MKGKNEGLRGVRWSGTIIHSVYTAGAMREAFVQGCEYWHTQFSATWCGGEWSVSTPEMDSMKAEALRRWPDEEKT
jgi:hypothetical protein